MSKNEKNINMQKPVTYTQIKVLGVGSFGKAYLVECNNDKSLAVIKTMIIENMDENEKKEAVLEAKILEKLDHPNIIKFREVFMARKPVFTLNIVMDFADGGDLQTRIKEQKGKHFSETQIIDWFTQICLAIKHIHDKKILHRDLKSQNVFLTKNGLVKLGDFGIAKCLNYTLEKAKTVVGTPYYLSPEIVENRPYSFKSDIWSLGVLLYEMTCLKMPFDASSLPMLYVKIIRGAYGPVSSTYSKDLRSLIGMLLNVDSEKRPTINDILRMPYLKSRIRNFLSEMEYNSEFSSTILKKYQNKNANPKSSNGLNVIPSLNQLSLNKDYGVENKPKANNNNIMINKPSVEVKNKEINYKNNLENYTEENKQEMINKPLFNPITKTSNSKNEFKNEIGPTNDLSNLKRRENDRKDIIDISDFIKNKKNDKKKTEMINQQNSNLSGNNAQSRDFDCVTNNPSNNIHVSVNNDKSKYNYAYQLNNNKGANEINYFEDRENKREKIERTSDLKDFMKKKKREKSMAKGEQGIIWMKGMEDMINLKIDSNNNLEKETNYTSNYPSENNSKSSMHTDYQEFYSNKMPSNDFIYNKKANKYNNISYDQYKSDYSNYSDVKDKEDYLNVHKMYINLDNIEKEVEIDDLEINQEDIKINDINSITRDFNIVSDNEYANSIQSNQRINNIYIKNYNKNSYNTEREEENIDSDNCIIESLRIELETTLGLKLFKTVDSIIRDNTDPNQFACDRIYLNGKIRRELLNKFSNYDIDKAIDKIPEIYSIILKEREMNC